ncbi:hypothetical protein AB0H76_00770 [Nocardia sp. NPDC050712]|uniref:hypothetical protein n=1 Tax=Nocardia sp. NPDC050712 TaxID=3155518 RepID=UPI0033ED8340
MKTRRFERSTLGAMLAGLGLTVLVTSTPYLDRSLLADHIRSGYPTYSDARIDSAVGAYLILLTVIGALGVLAWLGSAWAVKAGKRWARPAATTLFVLGTGLGLTLLLTNDASGDTGLAPVLGWAGMAPSLAGLVAVALLWRGARDGRTMGHDNYARLG